MTLRGFSSPKLDKYLAELNHPFEYYDEADTFGLLDDASIKTVLDSLQSHLKTEGRILIVSTPNNKQGFFYEMMKK